MDVGTAIRTFRIERGLTQKELGIRCGMKDAAIRHYESGRGNPTLETLQRIADALGVDPYSLYSFDQASTALEERINARIVDAASKLSDKGQEKVADYAEDLLPKYPRQQAPQRPVSRSRG